MATREVKTRFVLEGEQQFRTAMKNSANAIKVLNSEQKLAKAQFQQTGDAQKYASQQTEILKKKIEEQKAAVAAAEEAVRKLSENGVAENSRQMQQWKTKLNDAQTALVKMETELQTVSADSSEAAGSAEALGDSLQSIDKKASLEAVVSGVSRLSDGLGKALIKVKDLAQGLVSELRGAASWADDLATTALVYGMDTETLQRMQYASQLIDTDVETIIKSRQKLEQAMKNARPSLNDEDIKKGTASLNEYEQAFANVGVEIQRYGQYRNWEDVFWETGEAMMHMTDGLDDFAKANAEIVRDTTAQTLFGKSWRELIPLFTAGREAWNETMGEAAVVAEEDVGKLTELDDAVVKLQNQFDALKNTVLANLAPALTDLANSFSKLLGEFNEYLQTEEGQKAMSDLSEAVKGLFTDLTNTDFSSVLETVKGALDGINDALGWLKDNKDGVVTAIKAIAGAWAAMKVVELGATLGQFVSGMKGIFGHGGASSAAASAAASAARKSPHINPGQRAVVPDIAGKISGDSVAEALTGSLAGGGFLAKLAGSLPAAFATLAIPAIAGTDWKAEWDKAVQAQKAIEASGGLNVEKIVQQTQGKSGKDLWTAAWSRDSETVSPKEIKIEGNPVFSFTPEQQERIRGNSVPQPVTGDMLQDLASRYHTAFEELDSEPVIEAIYDNLSDATGDALSDLLETINDGGFIDPLDTADLIQQVRDELQQKITEGAADSEELNAAMELLGVNAVQSTEDGVTSESGNLYNSAEAAGENAALGLSAGISAKSGYAIAAAANMAAAVSGAIRGALQIASPSKVMEALGEFVGQGFAEGIESQIGTVNRAAEHMVSAVEINPQTGFRGTSGGVVDVTLMIGPDQLANVLVPLVDGAMGDEIALMRR